MSEQTINEQELKAPSKEEIIAFLQEQIEVKKVQLELQNLNTGLAKGRAEELQALQFIGNITNPQSSIPRGTKEHIVTQEDLDANPELIEAGVKVGDEVMIEVKEEEALPKKRNLKK